MTRQWRVVVDGEELFMVTGPDAEAMVRAAAEADGGAVSWRESVRPTIENGYCLHGPWVDVD